MVTNTNTKLCDCTSVSLCICVSISRAIRSNLYPNSVPLPPDHLLRAVQFLAFTVCFLFLSFFFSFVSFQPKACRTLNSLLKSPEETFSAAVHLLAFYTHAVFGFEGVLNGVFWDIFLFVFKCGAVFLIHVGAVRSHRDMMPDLGSWKLQNSCPDLNRI